MSFLNVRFPVGISRGASFGLLYRTDVVTFDTGHEARNQLWSGARSPVDAARACATEADRIELITFFRIAKGRAHTFRFKDWSDYTVTSAEGVVLSLGSDQYQLQKRYTNAGGTEDRSITKPISSTIAIYKAGPVALVSGVDYTLDASTGIITMLGSPKPVPVSWNGQFDIECRFDTDELKYISESLQVFRSQNIPLIEVKADE